MQLFFTIYFVHYPVQRKTANNEGDGPVICGAVMAAGQPPTAARASAASAVLR